MTTPSSELESLVKEYLELDQNPITKSDIQSLVKNKEWNLLEKVMLHPLSFGTAGLRAEMGSGYSRMNDLTIIQASQGLCQYLISSDPNVKDKGVVIGHDHRHHSDDFARLTAAVFLSKGIPVYYFHKLVHTPMVPFTVKTVGASCGIMITASHNPGKDNGYKVYASNACQIISPADKHIAAQIALHKVPWTWDYKLVETSPLVVDQTEEWIDLYFEHLMRLSSHSLNQSFPIRFCYTPMHGVGLPFATRAFQCMGLPDFVSVKDQAEPNPDFPTVAYPNPEEGEGALKLAMETADKEGATIILANDPDADRLAVAEKQPDGSWKIFTGNELGLLFGSLSLKMYQKRYPNKDLSKVAMLSSVVSCHALKAMAQKHGFHFMETLTGFKWLGNASLDLEKQGYEVLFAFEEAIGFMIGDVVRDKDGISALGVFAEWAQVIQAEQGLSMTEYLKSLYHEYGLFLSNNSYVLCHDKNLISSTFDKIRFGESPQPAENRFGRELKYPASIAGSRVVWIRDLTIGYDTREPDNVPKLAVSKSSQMITFELQNGCLFTLRTSGTEPKVKYYSESSNQSDLRRLVDVIRSDLLAPLASSL